MTGRIPARLVAGGEGKETGEQEDVKAHLMVCLDGSGMVGARWSTASRATAAEKNSGARRRLCCGGGLGLRRSLGATRDLGSTKGEVSAGAAVAEERGDGELRARRRSGGRRRCSGVFGQGTSERVKGLGCGASSGAEVRALQP